MNKKSKGLLGMASTLLLVASLSTSVAFAEEAGSDMEKSILWSGRIALYTAVFFIAAQIAGYFLNMPPTVNFGDSSKFEFILVSFWQIGTALLIASLIIKYLLSVKTSKASML